MAAVGIGTSEQEVKRSSEARCQTDTDRCHTSVKDNINAKLGEITII